MAALVAACSPGVSDIRAVPVNQAKVLAQPLVSSGATGQIQATIKDMSISLSSSTAPAGNVTFTVTNEGPSTHEFVVLKTTTQAADFPIASFEGEKDRFN
jgi:hypothetical protein